MVIENELFYRQRRECTGEHIDSSTVEEFVQAAAVPGRASTYQGLLLMRHICHKTALYIYIPPAGDLVISHGAGPTYR